MLISYEEDMPEDDADSSFNSPEKKNISSPKNDQKLLLNRKESVEPMNSSSPCRHRIKLDYGWKTLLRGMRQCLRDAMD